MITECPHCCSRFEVSDEFANQIVNCKNCGEEFVIEAVCQADPAPAQPDPAPVMPEPAPIQPDLPPAHKGRVKMAIPSSPPICFLFDAFAVALLLITGIVAFILLGTIGVAAAVFCVVVGGSLFLIVGGISALISYLHKILEVLYQGVYGEVFKK